LSAGNINDMTMAGALLAAAKPFDRLIADRGYDTNAIRALIAARGAQAVIPSTAARRAPIPYDRTAYRARNLVERLWCRLKDRYTLRQTRRQLSQRRSHRRLNYLLVQLSPDPRRPAPLAA
jgi:transposase